MSNDKRLAYAMKLLGETVVTDEEIRSGALCFKGHRITVGHILKEIFTDKSTKEIISEVAYEYDIDHAQLNKFLEFLTIFLDCKGVGFWTENSYPA